MIDIVILSNAKNPELLETTYNCLNSLQGSDSLGMNIIIAEQNNKIFYEELFENVKTYHYDYEFNYNKIVNEVLKYENNNFVGWFNNDVIFNEHWLSEIIGAMTNENADSASPYCPNTFGYKLMPNITEGTDIRKQLCGWAIVAKRKTLEKINWLIEDFKFWFADNVYGWQLEQNNLKHILVRNSEVLHLNGQGMDGATYKTLNEVQKHQYTMMQYQEYLQKYPKKITLEQSYSVIENNQKEYLMNAIDNIRNEAFKEKMNKLDCRKDIMETLDKNNCKLQGEVILSKQQLINFLQSGQEYNRINLSENNFEVVNV